MVEFQGACADDGLQPVRRVREVNQGEHGLVDKMPDQVGHDDHLTGTFITIFFTSAGVPTASWGMWASSGKTTAKKPEPVMSKAWLLCDIFFAFFLANPPGCVAFADAFVFAVEVLCPPSKARRHLVAMTLVHALRDIAQEGLVVGIVLLSSQASSVELYSMEYYPFRIKFLFKIPSISSVTDLKSFSINK